VNNPVFCFKPDAVLFAPVVGTENPCSVCRINDVCPEQSVSQNSVGDITGQLLGAFGKAEHLWSPRRPCQIVNLAGSIVSPTALPGTRRRSISLFFFKHLPIFLILFCLTASGYNCPCEKLSSARQIKKDTAKIALTKPEKNNLDCVFDLQVLILHVKTAHILLCEPSCCKYRPMPDNTLVFLVEQLISFFVFAADELLQFSSHPAQVSGLKRAFALFQDLNSLCQALQQ